MTGEAPALLGWTGEPKAVDAPGWVNVPGCADTPGCAEVPGWVNVPGCADMPGEVDTPAGCTAALVCRVPCKAMPSIDFDRVGTSSTQAAQWTGEAAHTALCVRDEGMMPVT